jgi:hypothetical protein
MGELPQTLEIIFQVQMKKTNEEMTRKKKAFQPTKCFFFSPFGPLLLSNFITFLFFIHLNAIGTPPEVLQII